MLYLQTGCRSKRVRCVAGISATDVESCRVRKGDEPCGEVLEGWKRYLGEVSVGPKFKSATDRRHLGEVDILEIWVVFNDDFARDGHTINLKKVTVRITGFILHKDQLKIKSRSECCIKSYLPL